MKAAGEGRSRATLLVGAASRVLFANKEAEWLTGIGGSLRLVAAILQAPVDIRHSEAANSRRRLRPPGDEVGAGGSLSLPRGANRLAKDFSPANLSLGLRGMSGGRAAAELGRIDGALRIPLEAAPINRWLPPEPSIPEKAPQ